MACFHPVSAWQDLRSREFVFSQDCRRELGPTMLVPCRQCAGCRLDYAAEWSMRAMHEASAHGASCFVTLTFSDEHFPRSQAEFERVFVLFLKRLRKLSKARIRTYGCLECGDLSLRPHAHFLVFGRDFSRDEPLKRGASGCVVYRSYELDALWGLGFASVGELTEESAGYVARYCLKKRSGRDGWGEFLRVPHPLTGEVCLFRPAMVMGRSRGLGRAWFDRFGAQCVEQGAVIERGGVRKPVPGFYRKLARRVDPLIGSDASAEAQLRAVGQRWNSTPERLAVREEVFKARTRSLKRSAL